MARFRIVSKDGQQVRYEGKPRYIGTYLKPSYIEFAEIASPVPVEWQVGDYVDYSRTGIRYRLYSIPQATKNARKGSHGRAFTYSNVQLHAATKELEIALFKDLVTADNNIHFSTNPDVVAFEDVYGVARRIQACMDYFFPDRWVIKVADFDAVNDADVIERISTAKDFALSDGTCLDALSKIYELWQEIGWMHSYENGKEVITIGYSNKRVDENTTESYLYGKGNGLTAIKKSQTNKDEFATRLYVYGSERNLPARYYNEKDILNADSVDIRHLMLPLDRWGKTDGLPDARKAYLENADAVAKYGLIPKTHYFDSDDAGADIYPTIEGMTAGVLRKVLSDMGQTKYSPSASFYPDSTRMDEVLSASNPSDDGVIRKGGQEYEGIEYVDISGLSRTEIIATNTTSPYYFTFPVASVEFQKEGLGEIAIRQGWNFILLGEGIESVEAAYDLRDAESGKQYTIKSEKIVAGEKTNDTTWSIPIPDMRLDFKKEYGVFKAHLSVIITVKPIAGASRTINLIAPSAPLEFNFVRKLATTFTIKLKQVGFDINERASQGEGKRISMKSGMCEGRDFQIKDCTYDKTTDTWNLVCKRQKDDSLGVMFPYNLYKIESGDRFVLLDIALPESYILVQQERLLSEGEKLLARASKVQSHYEPSIDAKVMIESGRRLREGMFMEIEDEDVVDGTSDYILIDTLNIYEDEDAIPTYKVTLREKRKVSYKGTPSATTESNTKAAEDTETIQAASVDLAGYATEKFVEEKIGEMFYWADEDKTTIGTKYNFFSERENAAGGIGEESEGGCGGIVDTQMSDTSDNAIANRVVKQYIDKTDAALMERIAALELGGGGGSGENPSGEGDKNYYHTQGTPAAEWVIEHNLGKYPSVTVVSSAGEEIYCDKTFLSMNKVVLNFGTEISGAAFLN